MMYGTGATIYGTDNLTELGHRRHSSPSSRWSKGLEETAVLDLISPPAGAPLVSALGDIGGFRHTDLDAVPPMMFTQPDLHHHHQPGLRRAHARRHGAGRQLHRRGPPTTATSPSPPTAARTGSRAASRPASPSGGTVARRRPTAAGSSGRRPARQRCIYSVGFGSSWTAVDRPPGRRRGARPTGSTRASSTRFAAGKFYVSTNGGATSPPPRRPGCPPRATSSFKAVPGVEGDIWLAGGDTGTGGYGLWHSTDSGRQLHQGVRR